MQVLRYITECLAMLSAAWLINTLVPFFTFIVFICISIVSSLWVYVHWSVFFFDWLSFLLFDWYHFVQTNTQTENKLVSWIIVSTMGALTPIFLRQKVCILRIVFNHFMVTMIVCTLHRSFPSLSSFSSLYRSHFKSKANTDFQYKVFQCNRIVNIPFWNKLNCVCELLVKRRSDKWIWSDVRVGICFLREFSSNII